MPPPAKELGQRQGRKRITLACNGCRAKRTKCDGQQPQCTACKYRQQECDYTQEESKRRRPSNAYVLGLEARVATLEKRLALASQTSTQQCAHECENCHERITDGPSAYPSTSPSHSSPFDELEDDETVDELADALGCFTLGDTGELRFFGASSNFDLVPNHSLKVASSVEARNRGIAAARQMPGFFEPSDELRDHLLAFFWRWQNSWQYVVPRESFVTDLYVTKSGRYCTPLLLTAILALASRYSPRLELRTDPNDANTAGNIFATQGKMMLQYEYEAPTTSTVQATALLGLFWASIDNEGLGFMYIGMASRMAMNLGLQSDCTSYASKGLVSEEDVEARNVAFWGVYVLDKLYCLGMGRPASIQEYNITTRKPKIQDRPVPELSEEQARISQPWPTSHITENAMRTCEIMIITSEVIDQLYAQRSTWTEREREDRIMQAHLKSVQFFDQLPKSLKISESSLQPSPPYVYQLHLQYHHSIILLHRPFFKVLSRGRKFGDYDPDLKDVHSRSCKTSAVKISKILRIYKNNYTNVSNILLTQHDEDIILSLILQRYIPISAVHPTFTAAIIHLLDLKTTGPDKRNDAMRNLIICVKALYEMNTNWDWANRSIRAIRSLAEQWGVNFWTQDLEDEIREENRQQYDLYENGSVPAGQAFESNNEADLGYPVEVFDDLFQAWTYDQNLTNMAFNFFDEGASIVE
ncbi:hypothetical protein AK830_g5456 [Neonectria ditissima]|uniref:Zn(2)-C6 fungal-type domain-containing protein n=1 Tax=Neonectria ditissima TaxID=78410 RepID=A0A0P7BL51_9HYPO|nr:hypothetical protein AK830_g5456 [Neonectria ditissima]